MLAVLIRILTERAIHIILHDYASEDIRLELTIFNIEGNNRSLYDIAVELEWEGNNLDNTEWLHPNPDSTRTTIFR